MADLLQNIPEPRTLDEFECREFAPDNTVFSSFAYLIGAVRCTALALSIVPKTAKEEDSIQVIQAADSALNGWLLLLPKNCRPDNRCGWRVQTLLGELKILWSRSRRAISFSAHVLIRQTQPRSREQHLGHDWSRVARQGAKC